MPFGFRIAPDTLPSGIFRAAGSSGRVRLSPSCPFKLLHTRLLSRPARHYPRFRIRRSSSERRGDFNPPDSRAAQRTLRASPPPQSARPVPHGRPVGPVIPDLTTLWGPGVATHQQNRLLGIEAAHRVARDDRLQFPTALSRPGTAPS